uniref:Uncharacterized protein n=1 Tax=uncultured Caudovirales phage TaxID=2100421 RepID=A0A6J5L564_9CAUD|nr:hypothetical protein UFOVP114_30 [uncultured Caudovirales phage]
MNLNEMRKRFGPTFLPELLGVTPRAASMMQCGMTALTVDSLYRLHQIPAFDLAAEVKRLGLKRAETRKCRARLLKPWTPLRVLPRFLRQLPDGTKDLHWLCRVCGRKAVAQALGATTRTLRDMTDGTSALSIDDLYRLTLAYPLFDVIGTVTFLGSKRKDKAE